GVTVVGSGMILNGGGYGGAVYQDTFGSDAPLSVSVSTFTNNQAVGGAGNAGGTLTGDGIGGGLIVLYYGQATAADVATVAGSTFTGNQAVGGSGGAGRAGADGLGGALANLLGSTLTVSGCAFGGNQAIGGAGGSGGNGF